MGNDFHGVIEQYNYTPEITIQGSGEDMWGTSKGRMGEGFGIGMGTPTTPEASPVGDGWGGFVKKPRSPHPASSSTWNQQPGGSNLSSTMVHQHERFGKAYDEVDVALDLAQPTQQPTQLQLPEGSWKVQVRSTRMQLVELEGSLSVSVLLWQRELDSPGSSLKS